MESARPDPSTPQRSAEEVGPGYPCSGPCAVGPDRRSLLDSRDRHSFNSLPIGENQRHGWASGSWKGDSGRGGAGDWIGWFACRLMKPAISVALSLKKLPPPGGRTAKRVRTELAREIHDRVAPALTLMLLEIEDFKAKQVGRESVLQHLAELQGVTRGVLTDLRGLVSDLRSDSGVDARLEDSVAELLRRVANETRIKTVLEASSWPVGLPALATRQMLGIVTEAINNARFHSKATLLTVRLQATPKHLTISVIDDGIGQRSAGMVCTGMGLLGIRERVAILGGSFAFIQPPGGGTAVRVSVPLKKKTWPLE
jgi:hypothetical protein